MKLIYSLAELNSKCHEFYEEKGYHAFSYEEVLRWCGYNEDEIDEMYNYFNPED